MDRNDVNVVVRVTLAMLNRIAKQTRTPADDLMASILKANEQRIVDAAMDVLSAPAEPLTDQRIGEALARVGIKA